MIIVNINLANSLVGSIVDVETTDYLFDVGELITFGYLTRNGFTIIQRTGSLEEFRRRVLDCAKSLGPPLYAFSRRFEENFLNVKINVDLQNGEESSFSALKEEGLVNLFNRLNDPLNNREVPSYWEAYKTLRNPVFLSKIIRHNYCCLCKEYYLKLRRIDGLPLKDVKPFLPSVIIEAKWITPKLEVALFEVP